MAENRVVDIDALIAQGEPVRDAMRRGAHEAMKRHIQAGVPMVSRKDGETVMLSPEELRKMLAEAEPSREFLHSFPLVRAANFPCSIRQNSAHSVFEPLHPFDSRVNPKSRDCPASSLPGIPAAFMSRRIISASLPFHMPANILPVRESGNPPDHSRSVRELSDIFRGFFPGLGGRLAIRYTYATQEWRENPIMVIP
ncbi:MAG: hypothetical protein LBU64_09480 [Planctomycetota bacterium]|jgi:hypothetical protein|nr:hypothetical protein [Planctomycetota bacterium]